MAPDGDHGLQHDIAPGDRPVEVDGRGIARRGLDQAGEQRRFRDREIAGALAEISARRRLDAVQAVAEVHLVQVHLEDLVLAVHLLEVRREDHFLELPAVGLVAAEEALPGELLRDGAAAFGAPSLLQVLQDRRGDANAVNAAVLVEALVLDRHHRLDQVRRDLPERNVDALFLEDGERRFVGRVEDRRRLRHVADTAERAAVGQARGEVVAEPCGPPADEEHDDREHRHEGRQDAGPARQHGVDPIRAEAIEAHPLYKSKMEADPSVGPTAGTPALSYLLSVV